MHINFEGKSVFLTFNRKKIFKFHSMSSFIKIFKEIPHLLQISPEIRLTLQNTFFFTKYKFCTILTSPFWPKIMTRTIKHAMQYYYMTSDNVFF